MQVTHLSRSINNYAGQRISTCMRMGVYPKKQNPGAERFGPDCECIGTYCKWNDTDCEWISSGCQQVGEDKYDLAEAGNVITIPLTASEEQRCLTICLQVY